MQTTSPVLEAINLTKTYDYHVTALDNLNLSVGRGEIYSLLGGNGAGKTTTMNLFLNFIEPSSGKAIVNGVVTHEEPIKAKQYVAFVSENVQLYGQFTAVQNLDFFTRIGGNTHYTQRDYEQVLLRVGLQKEAHHRKLSGFSKGMRQKCGIAIAILKNTPAILLDEPTSGLDPKAGNEFSRLLAELRDEGKAILMSTHDIFRAKEISDTVGIMNQGKLVMQKSAEELKGENLESLYLHFMAGYMEETA
ncbi:ABC transporter ATP-binding protein [bacterium]|nr:MAG: ABC transporter ATP-binding protein [bacterium]